jgi:predicted O-linked N-acetylglucosamine transferase (SPINDLY family)
MIVDTEKSLDKAQKYLIKGNYAQASYLYEQAIAEAPNIKNYYWYLGLLLLLQGQETEAQMTWMLALTEVEEDKIEFYTNELIQVLEEEAERQEKLEKYSIVWLIRQHMREINPNNLDNLLKSILLSIHLENFEITQLKDWGLIELIQVKENLNFNSDLLLQVLQDVLQIAALDPISLELAEACLNYFSNPNDCFNVLLPAVMKIGHTFKEPAQATQYLELYLRFDAKNLEALRHLSVFYQCSQNYFQGIETARLCCSLSDTLAEQIFSTHLLLRGLMSAGGYWQEVNSTCEKLECLYTKLIETQPSLDELKTLRLLTPAFAIPHIKDNPQYFREIHNQVANIFQTNIQAVAKDKVEHYSQRNISYKSLVSSTKPLKIGYLSFAFRRHSVGWLARWLLQHHNREKFETYAYMVNYRLVDDFLQDWYVDNVSHARKLGMNGLEIAEKISEDEIDILIDLDSLTLDITSQVVALKPAPVQVTWLGWDASGIPAIDYYIADPYVLPESAQNYYTEKIWRLPQTYIAVDGFEVGVPTLRRDDLDIPGDAVVYLSAQRGQKRHPDTTRWQMKILKEVPNSYFLIKGDADEEAIKNFFYKIAEEESVDCSRLRFLPQVALEANHRANLGIADVVLDTYPYNGATTTLETLWMGIPIVTRVGEQFAARNSYTMMMNAGITEGIAWTDEEYIEWGIRLGKDAKLRQEVVWKLRQSRQTAPLWNGKQFTREMEKAYEQMWANYISSK